MQLVSYERSHYVGNEIRGPLWYYHTGERSKNSRVGKTIEVQTTWCS